MSSNIYADSLWASESSSRKMCLWNLSVITNRPSRSTGLNQTRLYISYLSTDNLNNKITSMEPSVQIYFMIKIHLFTCWTHSYILPICWRHRAFINRIAMIVLGYCIITTVIQKKIKKIQNPRFYLPGRWMSRDTPLLQIGLTNQQHWQNNKNHLQIVFKIFHW